MFRPKLVLAPTDFSAPANEALSTAADIATHFGAALLVAHIVPQIPKLPADVSIFNEAEYERRLQETAARRVADLVAKYTAAGIAVRPEVGIANDAAIEIVRIAEHQNADLVVIATHGTSGWNKLIFGSVTEKVVRLVKCSVLLIRAPSGG